MSRFLKTVGASLPLVLFLWSGPALMAQDDDDPVLLYGSTRLVPPGDDEEASGRVCMLQRDERIAIHVRVRHLEPGATYDVSASRDDGQGGEETAVLGSITTREEQPASPPRCFRARLELVADEEGGDGGGGFWWWRRDEPHGSALLYRNSEGTELSYRLYLRGLEGDVVNDEARVEVGENVILTLPLDEELSGSVEITEEQLTALASGDASLVVDTDADESLSGSIRSCFPWLDRIRERIAARRVGSGALRLDTDREDEMPFGVTSLMDLVGVTVSVKDAGGEVVLEGTIDEVREIVRRHRWQRDDGDDGDDGDTGEGGGGSEEADDWFDLPDDFSFVVAEPHDASLIRGDFNDDRQFNLTDVISVLGHLFRGDPRPYCLDAGDANDDGVIDISDPLSMLFTLFQGQGPLRAPLSTRGFDRSPDELFCED